MLIVEASSVSDKTLLCIECSCRQSFLIIKLARFRYNAPSLSASRSASEFIYLSQSAVHFYISTVYMYYICSLFQVTLTLVSV